MSFVRTLATLAVGFAAAKGFDQLNKAGGLKGLAGKMSDPAQTQGVSRQVGQMLEQIGVTGGEARVQEALAKMGLATSAGTDSVTAGFGRLMAALGGATAAGAGATTGLMDALTGGNSTDAMEAQAKLMVRAMIEAAKADGEIDAEERERIMDMLADVGPDERDWVKALLSSPVDLDGLVAETTEAMKSQVYAASVAAVRVDSAAEAAYLRRLAAALGLSAETLARIHGDT